ncbi:MAG: hypothetical protein COA79_04075 [Planctomycetota bacterium]|nr:MAG: hypothetical protein COA79_04075 [Planctomycetota bacterium]
MAMINPDEIKNVSWHTVDEVGFRLTGFPWYSKEKKLNRLPTETKLEFREELIQLGKYPTGGQIAFQSDSSFIYVKVKLADVDQAETMPLTATGGFDLYVGPPGKQTFYLASRWGTEEVNYCCHLFEHDEKSIRNFVLNFPLKKEVLSFEVGLEKGCELLEPMPYDTDGKIVFYGTSITHGLCVARPGLIYPNKISRTLNKELVNFGFNGNAKGDLSIATALSGISDVSIFILDYEANCTDENYMDTIPPFIEKLRNVYPETPILLLSRPPFSTEIHQSKALNARMVMFEKQKEYINLNRQSDPHLYFKGWHELLGPDFHEYTTDSVHPNSLGSVKMAEVLSPVIREILNLD